MAPHHMDGPWTSCVQRSRPPPPDGNRRCCGKRVLSRSAPGWFLRSLRTQPRSCWTLWPDSLPLASSHWADVLVVAEHVGRVVCPLYLDQPLVRAPVRGTDDIGPVLDLAPDGVDVDAACRVRH